ncbi:SDR family NAD(P)-dependent oxidoreductase [Jannaschia sp. CCS1]|uniref:SDR family NAD(P)-dependent oxidoreductase n=1 Tax=Jannaschia sp. (strain CCS1) TaxID=290400 RepID=UPI000053A189|nr:SDR family NAD(P)-dependent oxidoreductase [Jannaschia sp. CCS1]
MAMKTALVTGGSGDIGRAIGQVLIDDGYRVGLLDLDQADVRTAAEDLGATGLVADVTNESDVERAIADFGAVPDLVVNNAGIGRFASLLDMEIETFRRQLDVNLTGAFIVARAAAKGMVERGSGVILNITSINAITTGPGTGSYPAAKAGLAKLTEMMALEWGPLGVRVNAIAPGFIDAGISTPFYADPAVRASRGGAVPSRRLGVSEDIANAVSYLASDKASYVNGHHLVVDGGVSVSLLTQLPRVAT